MGLIEKKVWMVEKKNFAGLNFFEGLGWVLFEWKVYTLK